MLLLSEIFWIATAAYALLGGALLVLYRKVLPRVMLSRVKQEKRRLSLPDFSSVVTVFVFVLIVLLLISVFQMDYDRFYAYGRVSKDFFLFDQNHNYTDTIGILFFFNFVEAGLFYAYDCILYKSFRRVGFSFLPLSLCYLLLYFVADQNLFKGNYFGLIILFLLFLVVNSIVPLLKIVSFRKRGREMALLLLRGVWRTCVIFFMFFLTTILDMDFWKIFNLLSYFGIAYIIALIFSLTSAFVKTLTFFSDFAWAERAIERLNVAAEKNISDCGEEEEKSNEEDKREDLETLEEFVVALQSSPQRFFTLYDWILNWKYPKAYQYWKKH